MKPSHAALAAACCFMALAACSGLTSADDKAVAIEVVSPPDSLDIGDTALVHVRVLNRAGDSIPNAPVFLTPIHGDSLLTVDTTRVAIVGKATGIDSVVVTSGSLPSAPFRVVVR